MKVNEYRILFADLCSYYFTGSSFEKAKCYAEFFRGYNAPIVSVDVLELAQGPTRNLAGAGYFVWVPAE